MPNCLHVSDRQQYQPRGPGKAFTRIRPIFPDTLKKQKGPVFRLGLSLLFDAWQFPTLAWGDPTLPSALRRFTSEFGMGSGGTTALQPPGKFFTKCQTLTRKTGADTQSRTGDLTLTKGALYQLSHISTLNLMPGSSLLSHGETPHYHRRYGVSLLSSAWGQVGPPRYSRQANSVYQHALACRCNLYQAECRLFAKTSSAL